jgi:hypothetical protein
MSITWRFSVRKPLQHHLDLDFVASWPSKTFKNPRKTLNTFEKRRFSNRLGFWGFFKIRSFMIFKKFLKTPKTLHFQIFFWKYTVFESFFEVSEGFWRFPKITKPRSRVPTLVGVFFSKKKSFGWHNNLHWGHNYRFLKVFRGFRGFLKVFEGYEATTDPYSL